MQVYVVTQDRNGLVTVRTTPVAPKYLSGPDKSCTQVIATLNNRTARKIGVLASTGADA